MRGGCRYLQRKSLALVAFGWLVSVNSLAAKWEGDVVVSPGLVYTDNVCLTKSDKKDDFTGVATVAPSGAVSMESSKTKMRATGSLSVNSLTNGDLRDDGCTGDALDDRQQFFPRLFATLNTILLSDWVKLDANIRADQNRVNSSVASSDDDLNRNGNTNTYYRYLLSPYTSRRLAGRTTFDTRYTYSEVLNTSDQVSDSSRHALTSNLNGEVGPRITWNLGGRYSRTSYNDDVYNFLTDEFEPREDTELKSASMRLGYQVSRSWQVNGSYGWEWNDFQTLNNGNTGGAAWDVGVKWTPSPRTTVQVGSGDRFFGKTPRVSVVHVRKRSTFSGSYNKRITFQRDLATEGLGNLDEPGFNGFGDPIFTGENGFDANGDPVDEFGTNSSISSNSAILDERLTLRYSYSGRPGTLTAFGSYSEQTRADDGAQADFGEWEINFRPSLSRKYNVVASIGWEEAQPAGFVGNRNFTDFTKSETWIYRLQYIRPINTRLSMNLEYRFTDRTSDDSLNEYQENMVRASFNFRL